MYTSAHPPLSEKRKQKGGTRVVSHTSPLRRPRVPDAMDPKSSGPGQGASRNRCASASRSTWRWLSASDNARAVWRAAEAVSSPLISGVSPWTAGSSTPAPLLRAPPLLGNAWCVCLPHGKRTKSHWETPHANATCAILRVCVARRAQAAATRRHLNTQEIYMGACATR